MSVKLSDDLSVPTASARLAGVIAIGIIVGIFAGVFISWAIAPLVAWDVAAIIYMATVWLRVRKFDASMVRKHALREDPSRASADIILIIASVASLGAVGLLLVGSKDLTGAAQIGATALALISVVTSWFIVHTIFALKYAEAYYTKPEGGIDLGDDKSATYVDFVYVAFTLGMTYQVSDTTLQTRKFRTTAIKHALLSYAIGTAVVATTVNLIASLGK
jgi:uncharacterized membrane protein